MFDLIKTQLKIGMSRKGFQVSFILLLTYALGVSLYYAYMQRGEDVSYLFSPAILTGIAADTHYVWYFCKYFPFIAVLPAGFSIFSDKSTKIIDVIQTRSGVMKYYISKIISTFILGWIVFAVPFIMELILNMIIFPLDATKAVTNWPAYTRTYITQGTNYIFSDLYFYSPYLYSLFSIFLTGTFAGCASVFVAAFGVTRLPYKIFLFLPLYLVMYLVTVIGAKIDAVKYCWDFYITAFDGVEGKSLTYYFSYMLLLLLTGSIMMIVAGRRNQLA